MKAKRRQELQTNWLADHVGIQLEAVKPYVTWIVGGLIAVVLLMVVVSMRRSRQEETAAVGWQQFNEASTSGFTAVTRDEAPEVLASLKQLQSLADEHRGTALALYAELAMADIHLRSGQQQFSTNNVSAKQQLKEAAKHYEAVATASDEVSLANRATFGLAKSYEWLYEFDKAKEHYAKVEGPYGAQAQDRLRDLERPSTRDFYSKFAKWKPKPPPAPPDERYPGFELDPDKPLDGEIDYQSYLDMTLSELGEPGEEDGSVPEPPEGPAGEEDGEAGVPPAPNP